MNQRIKKLFAIILTLSVALGQNAELITQKINVENAIRDKVSVTINKLVNRNDYVIIVNARMDLKPSFQMNDVNQKKSNSQSMYNPIPGVLPTLPKQNIQEPQTNIAGRPIAPTDKSIDFLFSTMTSRHFDQIYESIRRAESDAKIHPSEIVLSKLFAIWKYSTIGNLDVSRFTRELSHNQQFALFFAKGQ